MEIEVSLCLAKTHVVIAKKIIKGKFRPLTEEPITIRSIFLDFANDNRAYIFRYDNFGLV
jgi:hypothetical protein